MKMAKDKAKGSMVVSLSELSQEIDLKEYLGRKPSASEKKLFADLAVDTIANRTLDTDDINGIAFAKYSEAYAEKKGVTVNSVDLFLDGDMLGGIGRRSSKEKVGSVFLQMKKGLQTKKGYNHQVGDTLAQREFFGITDDEAKSIAREIKDNNIDEEIKENRRSSGFSFADLRAALDLLDIEQTE